MSVDNVTKAIKSIKIKNREGYNRIPQGIMNEGMEVLLEPTYKLFNLIYTQTNFPNRGE